MSTAEFTQLWNAIDALPLLFKLDVIHWDALPDQPIKTKIMQEGKVFYPLH